jgi:hypothetical protein
MCFTGLARWFVSVLVHLTPMITHPVRPCLRVSRHALLGAVLLTVSDALAEAPKRYNLPAGDAAEMLQRFSQVSGHETLFSSADVRGLRTAAVRGRFTAREALERMLSGTGLAVVEDEATGALALRPRSESPKSEKASRARRFSVRALVASIAAISAQVAAGQTAPATPTAGERESAVVLSPFEVNAAQDQGYLATNTLSGSRDQRFHP